MISQVNHTRNNIFKQSLPYDQYKPFLTYKSPTTLNLTKEQSTMNSISQKQVFCSRASPQNKFCFNYDLKDQRLGIRKRLQKFTSGNAKLITLSPPPKSKIIKTQQKSDSNNPQNMNAIKFRTKYYSPQPFQPSSISRGHILFPQPLETILIQPQLSLSKQNSQRFTPADYRLAESTITPIINQQQPFKLDESSIIEHTTLEKFTLLAIQSENENYKQTLSLDKQTHFLVSVKIYNKGKEALLKKQIEVSNIIGKNQYVLAEYGVNKNLDESLVLIRQPYKQTLKQIAPLLNQQNIHTLINQLLSIFEFLSSTKLLYVGDLFQNICNTNQLSTGPQNNIYKIKNLDQSQHRPDHSKKYFRIRYFKLIKQFIKIVFQINEQYYSIKQKRFISKQLKELLSQLQTQHYGFASLKNNTFLINTK